MDTIFYSEAIYNQQEEELVKRLLNTSAIALLLFLQSFSVQAFKLDIVTAEFSPYIFEENGQITGIHVDIITEACKELGIEPSFHMLPFKRAMLYMKRGEVDAIFSPIKTDERMKYMYYSSYPIEVEKTVFMALKDSGIKITEFDDLKGKSVGVIGGYSYSQEFDDYEWLYKEAVINEKLLMKKLSAGRTELVVGEEGNLLYTIKKYGLKNIVTVFTLKESPNYITFSKKALGEKGKVLAEQFGQILRRYKEEGIILKIRKKYL